MQSKGLRYGKVILCAGGAGCDGGKNMAGPLASLQALSRLKSLGLSKPYGSVNICSLLCEKPALALIKRRERETGRILILKESPGGFADEKRKYRHGRKIQLTKLIAAAASNELSYFTGPGTLDLKILPFTESIQVITGAWNEKKEEV